VIKGGPYTGVIKGKVVWEGDPPNLEEMSNKLVAQMKANAADGPYCLSGSALEKQEQAYRIGENGNLGNVFVWIAAPQGQVFNVPESQIQMLPRTVVVSQPHCMFLPHCASLTAARYKDGVKDPKPPQKLVVQNDAEKAHNALVAGGVLNRPPNQGLSPRKPGQLPQRVDFDLQPDDDPITVRCGVHGWMLGYVRAFDHPYHAVTSVGARELYNPDLDRRVWENLSAEDFGTFEIRGVPVGAKVTLYAWHEDLGELLKEEITLAATNERVIKARRK